MVSAQNVRKRGRSPALQQPTHTAKRPRIGEVTDSETKKTAPEASLFELPSEIIADTFRLLEASDLDAIRRIRNWTAKSHTLPRAYRAAYNAAPTHRAIASENNKVDGCPVDFRRLALEKEQFLREFEAADATADASVAEVAALMLTAVLGEPLPGSPEDVATIARDGLLYLQMSPEIGTTAWHQAVAQCLMGQGRLREARPHCRAVLQGTRGRLPYALLACVARFGPPEGLTTPRWQRLPRCVFMQLGRAACAGGQTETARALWALIPHTEERQDQLAAAAAVGGAHALVEELSPAETRSVESQVHLLQAAAAAGRVATLAFLMPETQAIDQALLDCDAAERAAGANRVEALAYLCARGFDLLRHNETGYAFSPLHSACANDAVDAATYLMELGAQVDLPSQAQGGTPLQIALNSGSIKTIEMMVRRGVSLAAHLADAQRSWLGPLMAESTLTEAQRNNVLALLFSEDYWPSRGGTPNGAKRLLDIDITDANGWTALHFAEQLHDTAAIELLASWGANVDL